MLNPEEDLPQTEEEWHKRLTPEQYAVLREKGTEAPGSGALLKESRDGMYRCVACNAALFPSDMKFNSGSGWPSFSEALPDAIELRADDSLGMKRTEVVCASCGSHLGHVFDDGPTPSGKRYCLNSVCLGFEQKDGPEHLSS
jgi:peptide-methionine (R)-S-oxide reductase